jgi:hypothetical protein
MAGFRDSGNEVIHLEWSLFGHNMNVRAEVFRKIGGFSPDLGRGWEDTEISLRMRRAGFRLIYAPQILVRRQLSRHRLTRAFLRRRFFQQGRAIAYYTPLPVSLVRYGLYVAKNTICQQARAIWHRHGGRLALALRCQCEARTQEGFWWQHARFRCGVPSRLSTAPLPSVGGAAVTAPAATAQASKG